MSKEDKKDKKVENLKRAMPLAGSFYNWLFGGMESNPVHLLPSSTISFHKTKHGHKRRQRRKQGATA